MQQKKMYRPVKGRVLAGVCAGVAEYFDISVTAVRLIWSLFALSWGLGILAYLLSILALPRKPDGT